MILRAPRARALAGLALAMLASCAGGTANRFPVTPAHESGEDSFRRSCAPCHGADARGGGTVARALRVPPPDLTLLAGRYGGVFPRELVIATITGERPIDAHGDRDMPVWSQRFGPVDSGAAAVAAAYARRRVELLADHIGDLQAHGR